MDTPIFGDFGVMVVLCPGGSGKPRAPERWPESSGRGLGEAFFCQIWLFSVLLGRLQVAPGGVQLRPRRFLEVRRSQSSRTVA